MALPKTPKEAPKIDPKFKEWGEKLVNELFGSEEECFTSEEMSGWQKDVMQGLYGKDITIGEIIISYLENPETAVVNYLSSDSITKTFIEKIQSNPDKKAKLEEMIKNSSEDPDFQKPLMTLLEYVDGKKKVEEKEYFIKPDQTGVAIDVPGTEPKDTELAKELEDAFRNVLSEKFKDNPEEKKKTMALFAWAKSPELFKKNASKEEKNHFRDYLESLKNSPDEIKSMEKALNDSNTSPAVKVLFQLMLDHIKGKTDLLEVKDSELAKTLTEMCNDDPEKQVMLMAVVKWIENPESFKKDAGEDEKKAFRDFLEYLKTDRKSLDEKVKDPDFPEEDKKILQKLLDHMDGKTDLLAVDKSDEDKEKDKKGTGEESFDAFKRRIKNMSMGALLAELFKKLKDLFGNFKSIKEDISNKVKSEEYTKAEVKKIDLNYERVEKKEYTSDNRDVEYVASMLGDKFPTRPSAQTFMLSLLKTFNKKIDKNKDISSLQRGDVLFFHDGKNKEKAALTAIVYSVEPPPPIMKYVSGSTKPQPATIEESDLFKNKWLGSIRPTVKSADETEEKPEEKAGSDDKPGEEAPKQ